MARALALYGVSIAFRIDSGARNSARIGQTCRARRMFLMYKDTDDLQHFAKADIRIAM